MPPVRYRLRAIMIAIASLAVWMAMLRLTAEIDIFFAFSFVLATIAVVLVVVAVPISDFAVRSWRRRTRRRELSMADNRPEAGIRAKRGAGGSVG
jgi:hypothetical protein